MRSTRADAVRYRQVDMLILCGAWEVVYADHRNILFSRWAIGDIWERHSRAGGAWMLIFVPHKFTDTARHHLEVPETNKLPTSTVTLLRDNGYRKYL